MSPIEHSNDADLADFLATWRTGFEYAFERWLPNAGSPGPGPGSAGKVPGVGVWANVVVTYAVIGLTNFGERPVTSTRLAEVLGRPVDEAEALARQWGWPGTWVEDGLVSVDPERAKSASRRHVRIGDRRLGVTGCGFDIFQYAPLVRPSLHLEEACIITGTPIRIVFSPAGVESVEPGGAVMVQADLRRQLGSQAWAPRDVEEVDANICAQAPLFSSAQAAQRWLAGNPGGRIFPVREAWDLSPLQAWREGMFALLNLDN